MKLVDIYTNRHHWDVPFHLLSQRLASQSISHREMPEWEEHRAFVISKPYPYWYLIVARLRPVGCIYLTEKREIGIGILRFYQGKGYAKLAIYELMQMHPGRFLANINPANEASIKLFEAFGFKHIQNTYQKDTA
jgi:RimJ/RimL family protein N-acetyltransferase